MESHPILPKVAGSIPGQGICLACEFHPQLEYVWEAMEGVVSLKSVFSFLFLSPFLSL